MLLYLVGSRLNWLKNLVEMQENSTSKPGRTCLRKPLLLFSN